MQQGRMMRRRRAIEPVFVDRSGRRRRLGRLIGVAVAVLLTASLGVLVAGLFGGGPGGLPGFPADEKRAQPAHVRPAPTPHPSVENQPTAATVPDTTAPPATSATTTAPTAGATSPTPSQPGNGRKPTDHPTPSHTKK